MKKKSLIIISLLFAFVYILLAREVKATYRSNDPTVNSGGTISITVTSTEELENYDLTLKSYSGLTYVGCSASNAAVNSETGKISYASFTTTKTLGTYTFKAPTVSATTKYTVTFDVNGTTNKSTVTVNPTNAGNNSKPANNNENSNSNTNTTQNKGTITSLYINGIKCKEYVTVTNKESVPVVINTSTKEGATIYNNKTKKSYKVKSGATANVQISEGTNTLTITLDNGYKETRKIYSQKEEEVEANQIEDEQPEVKVEVGLKSLEIEGFNLTPEFSSKVYEYILTIPAEREDITRLDIKYTANSNDFTVDINGNDRLVEGVNVITILVKSKNGEDVTYIIKVIKEAETVETIAEPTNEIVQEVETIKELDMNTIIVIIIAVVTAIAGITFALIEYKFTKKNKDEEEIINPFANLGFNNENDEKEDILKEFKDDDKEQEKPKKRGRHF